MSSRRVTLAIGMCVKWMAIADKVNSDELSTPTPVVAVRRF